MKRKKIVCGPGAFEVCFVAWLGLFLGIAGAFLHLVFRPVAVVRGDTPDPSQEAVCFVEGAKDAELGKAWLQKLQAFREARSIRLSEEELNTAVSHPTQRPKASEETAAAETDIELIPGTVNFRIAEGELQIAMPFSLSKKGPVVIVQARGSFVQKAGGFLFEPRILYIGSCPVHRLPFFASVLLKRMEHSQFVPADLKLTWTKLSDVTISENQLCLNF